MESRCRAHIYIYKYHHSIVQGQRHAREGAALAVLERPARHRRAAAVGTNVRELVVVALWRVERLVRALVRRVHLRDQQQR